MDVYTPTRHPDFDTIVGVSVCDSGPVALSAYAAATTGPGLDSLSAVDVTELHHYNDGPAAADDHDAATCNDHHCRAHWVDVTAEHYDRRTGRLHG